MGAKTQNRERGTPFFFAAVEASSAARDHAEQARPRRRRRSLDLDLRGSLLHAPGRPRPGLDPLHRPGPGNARSPPRGSRPRDRRPPRGPQLRRGLRRGRGAVLWQVRLPCRRRRSRSVAPLLDGCRPGRRRRGRRPALRPGAGSAPRVPQEGWALGQAPESRGGGGSGGGGGGGRGEETSWREHFFPLVVARGGGKKNSKIPKYTFNKSPPPQRAVPVGLFNLGATCYGAGALQCLFADTAFRQGLYESATGGGRGGDEASQQQPPAADASGAAGGAAPASFAPGGDAAVRALRRLFASMQAGPAGCSADPGPLVRALGLDAGEQQDGQEFFKLLLALLEERLHGGDGGPATPPPPPPAAGAAEAPAAPAGLVPSLFRGRSSIETVCGLCQGRASSSDRVEEFTELAVPVRGSETLEHALASAAAPEYLPGEEFFFPLLSSFLPLLLLFERGSPTLFPPENDKNTPPIQTKRRRRRRGLHPLRPLRERARARHPPRRPPRPPSPPLRLAAAVRLRRGGDGEGESRGQDEFPPDAVGRASAG